MLRNLNQSSGGKRILGVPQVGILAAQIAAETATGDQGPGILYNESQAAGYAGKYLRAAVTGWPATGTLFVQENGSFEALGLPDGSHTFGYDLYVDGVYDSASTFTVAVGVVDATAAGATLTGAATITPGAASGEQNATAPGATLTGTATLTPGSASGPGVTHATAPGSVLTGSSSLTAGSATGEIGITQYPDPSDVRLGLQYGPTGTEYVGTMTEGSGPSAADIAAELLAALQGTTLPVNVMQVLGGALKGDGSPLNPWNPA